MLQYLKFRLYTPPYRVCAVVHFSPAPPSPVTCLKIGGRTTDLKPMGFRCDVADFRSEEYGV